jgi:hypothetical protein
VSVGMLVRVDVNTNLIDSQTGLNDSGAAVRVRVREGRYSALGVKSFLNLQQTHPLSTEQLPIHWAANLSPAQPSQYNALSIGANHDHRMIDASIWRKRCPTAEFNPCLSV